MDMQTADQRPDELSPRLLDRLLRGLAAALPSAEDLDAAEELFFAMQPRDAVEAAAAVRAVAAHFASMDMYARAARAGMSDDTVLKLRASANTCSRTVDAALRGRRRRTEPADAEQA